jgi:hypothetical protein
MPSVASSCHTISHGAVGVSGVYNHSFHDLRITAKVFYLDQRLEDEDSEALVQSHFDALHSGDEVSETTHC